MRDASNPPLIDNPDLDPASESARSLTIPVVEPVPTGIVNPPLEGVGPERTAAAASRVPEPGGPEVDNPPLDPVNTAGLANPPLEPEVEAMELENPPLEPAEAGVELPEPPPEPKGATKKVAPSPPGKRTRRKKTPARGKKSAKKSGS